MSITDVILEIKEKADNREVVLTGIDLSSYGLDFGSTLGQLCIEVNKLGMPFHLSSLEVRIITDAFIKTLAGLTNFRPSFHLSLQSGSDNVLRAMNRKYTTAEYFEKVQLIRKHFADAVITTDIICGFPTETEEDFLDTCEFVKKVNFSGAHIFPYSPRGGTVAAKLPLVQQSTVTRRTKTLQSLINENHTITY
jgi:threonylcarbamoyladenosine tRNA methylthiotransferase MtaB